MKFFIRFLCCCSLISVSDIVAQVGIGTTDPKASLDIRTSDPTDPGATEGILIPQVDAFPTVDPTVDQDGMLVFVTGAGIPAKGFYYWNQTTTTWTPIGGTGVEKIDDLSDGKSDASGSSIFLGVNAGLNNTFADNRSVGLGFETLKSGNTMGNTAVGYSSLSNNQTGAWNVAVGAETMNGGNSGSLNVALGMHSLYSNTNGQRNVAVGSNTLQANLIGSNNTALGHSSGYNSTGIYNVFLGYMAGYNETGNHKLYIENTSADADNALIYGEFNNNMLRVNGTLQVSNPANTGYAFPLVDGTAGQVLSSDGNGQLAFTTTASIEKIDDLLDGKSDATGSSVFLGVNAGLNDDGTDNQSVGIGYGSLSTNINAWRNTAIGYNALNLNAGSNNVAVGSWSLRNNAAGTMNVAVGANTLMMSTGDANTGLGHGALDSNTSGGSNVAIGRSAMDNNQTGIRNTAIGTFAGMSSVGNYNVFLGYYAGGNETGSNKLYIENSIADSDNALIYGEFDTNRLRVNGTLQIANPANTGYAFPLADGTAGQALRTDGNGQISFFTPIVGATKIDELIDGKTNSSSVFLGTNAGINISSGTSNVGVGVLSLNALTTGMRNTAMGYGSLRLSAYSTDNLAVGSQALWVNTTGSYNTASGSYALWSNTIGNHNTATGHQALFTFTGSNNTAVGDSALRGNAGSTGSNNTAVGYQALYQSTSGNYNVAIGHAALANNTTGSNNVAIGYDAHFTDPTLSNQVRIGNSAIWYAGVQVNWSITSDKRWKEQIRPLPFGLDMIEKLKPVDYIRKNNEFKTREIGFIAQDLKEVLDDLNYQDQGMLNIDSEGYMSVRYNDFIPVLVKAIQEQQQQLQEQQKQIDRLEALLEKAVGN